MGLAAAAQEEPEVEAKDTDGETVLYWAAHNGRSAVVWLLV
jgi:ankyrin repeat protein